MKPEAIKLPAKSELLVEALAELAGGLEPGAKLPTFRELCRTYAVSNTTLKRALAELEHRHVIRRQHGSGIYVGSAHAKQTIGLVLGENIFVGNWSPFWLLLMQRVYAQFSSGAYRLKSYLDCEPGATPMASHAQLAQDLKAKRLDGIVVEAATNQTEVDWLQTFRVPVVLLCSGKELGGWQVTCGSVIGPAVRALAARGCRRIALLDILPTVQRSSFAEALAAVGQACGPDQWWTVDGLGSGLTAPTQEAFGFRLIERLWGRIPAVDGLVIPEDTAARGALMALYKAGVAVGRDLQIAAGANKGSDVLEPYAADLTLVEHDLDAMAAAARSMIETLLRGGRPAPAVVELAPQVRPRD